MIIIGIILSVLAIAFFCWLLFTLAVYALPVFVGLAAAFAAHHDGYGLFASALIAIFAAGVVLAFGQLAFALVRTPILRAAIALIFAIPAASAGYYATLGMAQIGISSIALSHVLAVLGAMLVGGTAWNRMALLASPGVSDEAERACGSIAAAVVRRRAERAPLRQLSNCADRVGRMCPPERIMRTVHPLRHGADRRPPSHTVCAHRASAMSRDVARLFHASVSLSSPFGSALLYAPLSASHEFSRDAVGHRVPCRLSWLDRAKDRLRLDRLDARATVGLSSPGLTPIPRGSQESPPSTLKLAGTRECVVDRLRPSDRHRGRDGRGLANS